MLVTAKCINKKIEIGLTGQSAGQCVSHFAVYLFVNNFFYQSINQSFILTRFVKELKKLVQNTNVYK